MKQLSDEQLVELYKAGDGNAFDELLGRYKQLIMSAGRSFFFAGGDYDDVMQEGFLGLLKAANTFNGKSSFKSYAYLCIRSKIFNAIKSSQSAKNKPLNSAISIYSGSVELDKLLYDDPEKAFIADESVNEKIALINSKLSKMEILVFNYYMQGLSYTEIGRRMGKDYKSIDNALQRIKKKISELLI